jgi:lipoyl(octanoyl) transferase
MAILEVYKLGLTEYDIALKLQEEIQEKRIEGKICDTLLLLEHPPTLTLAKGGDKEDILVSQEFLEEKRVAVRFTDRGGNITFHGPGQIVGYPIFDLNRINRDIHEYILRLEAVLINVLKDFSINANLDPEHVGVWTGNEKIAAIGVKVKKWVTKHGFALNVNNDLSFFELINPCGIKDKGVTSMEKILKRQVPMPLITDALIEKFEKIFKMDARIIKEN